MGKKIIYFIIVLFSIAALSFLVINYNLPPKIEKEDIEITIYPANKVLMEPFIAANIETDFSNMKKLDRMTESEITQWFIKVSRKIEIIDGIDSLLINISNKRTRPGMAEIEYSCHFDLEINGNYYYWLPSRFSDIEREARYDKPIR